MVPSVRKVIEAHGLTMSDTKYTDDVWKEGPPHWMLMRIPELRQEYEKIRYKIK